MLVVDIGKPLRVVDDRQLGAVSGDAGSYGADGLVESRWEVPLEVDREIADLVVVARGVGVDGFAWIHEGCHGDPGNRRGDPSEHLAVSHLASDEHDGLTVFSVVRGDLSAE